MQVLIVVIKNAIENQPDWTGNDTFFGISGFHIYANFSSQKS